MHQEKAISRLINCLAGSLILHVFILSFSPVFWAHAGSSTHFGHMPLPQPLIVRLIPKQPFAVPVAKIPSIKPEPPSPPIPAASPIHTTHELSRMPEMIERPPEAMEIGDGISGEVVFKLSIDRFGKVILLQQLKSNLPRDVEGKLAIQLYRAKYRAGEIDGIPVDSEMVMDLRLDSEGWTDKLPVLRYAKPQGKP